MALANDGLDDAVEQIKRHSIIVSPMATETTNVKAWLRPIGLFILAALSLTGYIAIGPRAIDALRHPSGVAMIELLLAIPYAVGCWWVIVGPPPQTRRIRHAEWAIVIGAALAFFAVVFPLWPSLSGDPYRYVWDARVLAHGYNPLALAPDSPLLAQLRDTVIYPKLHWVHVPTIYPPGAQGLYLLAYLVAPDNVWAVKAEMALCVALTAALLVHYLRTRGQDPLRVIVWLWCPLVVIELGMDGHVDAAAIAVWLAALLLAERKRQPRARIAVGVLLGVAMLIKLYPALFLLALGRRDDRWLYVAFLTTVSSRLSTVSARRTACAGLPGNLRRRYPELWRATLLAAQCVCLSGRAVGCSAGHGAAGSGARRRWCSVGAISRQADRSGERSTPCWYYG